MDMDKPILRKLGMLNYSTWSKSMEFFLRLKEVWHATIRSPGDPETPCGAKEATAAEDTKARLKRLADARQRTSHWLMREAITQYVDREEKRESFRQDALKAWEAYRTTGLHVTAEEADAWLAKLEQGNDVDPPECHV